MEKYSSIIFAGQTERDKILCEHEGVTKKPFLRLGNKIFIERIVEEISKCEEIGDIYVSGMSENDWKTDLPAKLIDDQSTIFRKVIHIYDNHIQKKKNYSEIVVLYSCDGPLIKAKMISRHIQRCKDASDGDFSGIFYYAIIKREVMEEKFPNSKRSYATFKEFEVCGGDLIIINVEKMRVHEKLIDDLVEKRKNVLAQLIVLNPFLILRFLLKRLSVHKFMKSINKRVFKIEKGVYAVLSDDPEIAMDVDKPFQLKEVRRYYNENKELYD